MNTIQTLGIVGASGFIGGAITAAAKSQGLCVVAFSRRADVEVRDADETRLFPRHDPPDFSGIDAILNLAGESIFGYWTSEKRTRILQSRVSTTTRIVECLRQNHQREGFPCVLVNGSATGYYGDTGDVVASESSPRGTGFLAETTAEWEAAAYLAQEFGLRVVCIRTGFALGHGGDASKMIKTAFSLGLGGRFGNGKQWMPWVHVEDVAGIFIEAACNPQYSGPVNAVAPVSVTNAHFTRTVAKVLNRPAWFPAPEGILRTVLGDMSSILLDSSRVKPEKALALGYEFRYADFENACRAAMKGC